MSNVIQPKLNTILPPLPKKNIIIPLDIISNNYDSFPPMKTPIIQDINKNILTFPDLRGVIINEKFNLFGILSTPANLQFIGFRMSHHTCESVTKCGRST